ncbi:MAG: hypothetical protein JNL28_12615 [Planctomycetes bacterium]|nr:hypothetical protein [Planctomycetota bacterium]
MRSLALLALFAATSASTYAQGGIAHFCPTGLNGSLISATGSSRLGVNGGAGDLVLHASNVPPGAPGVFVMSQAYSQPIPFGQGFRCISGQILRLPIVSNATFALDYTAPAVTGLFTPGAVWNFQFWFRAGGSFDLSDGVEITFDTRELVTNITNIEQSWFSGHPLAWTGGMELIQDQTAWNAFWAMHTSGQFPPTTAPPVDFNAAAVVAVFTGTLSHGGVLIAVRSCALSVTTLDVHTTTTGPGMFCPVPAVITQPCHIVSVPRVPNMTLGDWIAGAVFNNCP